MDTAQLTVIAVGVFIVALCLSGAMYNRWYGRRLMAWLEKGAVKLGRPGNVRWGNTFHSKAQLPIAEARAPFRKVELYLVLERRENPAMWLYDHLRGRRDELILRADLRQPPAQEYEARPKGSRGLERYRAMTDRPYRFIENAACEIAWRGAEDPSALERLQSFLAKYPRSKLRLSLQSTAEHLALRIHLKGLLDAPADDFFAALRQWLR